MKFCTPLQLAPSVWVVHKKEATLNKTRYAQSFLLCQAGHLERQHEIYTKADARTFVIRICSEDTAAYFHSTLPLPGLTSECKSLVHFQGKDTEGCHYAYGERVTTASRHDLSFVRMDCSPIHQVFLIKRKMGQWIKEHIENWTGL